MQRCNWVKLTNQLYIDYHDTEWGVPVHDDLKQFEFLILETFQAGLSWETVLNKREAFKEAFDNFDPEKIAKFDFNKIQELINNPKIIRNKLKIMAAISNAQRFLEFQERSQSFSEFMWSFVGNKTILNKDNKFKATTPESDKMSLELKNLGFKFVGSTVCYAHMQATGMVNDHDLGCFRHAELLSLK